MRFNIVSCAVVLLLQTPDHVMADRQQKKEPSVFNEDESYWGRLIHAEHSSISSFSYLTQTQTPTTVAPSMPVPSPTLLTPSPITFGTPTSVPSSTSWTSERIAREFLSVFDDETECQSKVTLDCLEGDTTTGGSTIPSEIALMTQLIYQYQWADFYNSHWDCIARCEYCISHFWYSSSPPTRWDRSNGHTHRSWIYIS